ncbi:MAG TPA: lysylphosphatidylglycerol synthase transmembrane domain-containing protein [Marmoricola sp.]|nr:lysylphosphatidylglycerol synthase transmembrane domain-containing protein [Marmoricola sp.]
MVLTAAIVEYAVVPQLVKARSAIDDVSGASTWLLPVALCLQAASLACYTWLTQSTVPVRHRVSWPTQLAMDLTGFAAAHVLPGGGTASSALRYRLMTTRRIPRPVALSTAAVEATFSYVALLATYCVGVALALPELNDHPYYVVGAVAGLGLIGASSAGFWALARSRPGSHVAPLVEPLRSVRLQQWARQWRRLVGEVRSFLDDHERRNVALVFALGNWLLDAACLWVCLAAFGAVVQPGLVLTAYGAANLLGLLPITPGGLGVVEGVLMPALVAFGVGGAVAVLGVLAWRVLQFWLPIPVGGAAYVALRVADLRAGRDLSASR